MTKEQLIQIKAEELIPTAYLKKSVTTYNFYNIVLPLFINAYHEKDMFMNDRAIGAPDYMTLSHKSAYEAYVKSLLLFYDEPNHLDEYDLKNAIYEALMDLRNYAYKLEAHQ